MQSKLNSFWILNLPIFLLIFFSFISYASSSFETISFIYFSLLSLSQAAWFSWLLLVVLPYSFYLISFKKLSAYWLAFPISILALFLLIIDKNIYSLFHLHLQWVFVQMILSQARSHIFSFSTFEWFMMFTVLIFLIGLEALFLLKLRKKTLNFYLIICIQLVFFCTGLVSQGLYVWADAFYKPQLLIASELVPGFYGLTAKRFLAKHHWIDVSKRPPEVPVSANSTLHYPLNSLKLTSNIKKTNILILALDSWRFDSMNSEITPQIAKLAAKASVYKNHFSGGNSTRAGIFSLFYSINPLLFDKTYREGLGPLLFDVLNKRQYKSYAFTSASALSPPFNRTVFSNLANFEPTLAGSNSVERDKLVSTKLIESIDRALKESKPFFAFGFYDSAHAYLHPPPPFVAKFQPSARVSRASLADPNKAKLWRNLYSNSLYFIDGLVGEVIEHLRAKQVLDDTLIIITGDHGEEFDDNHLGFWGHNSNFTPAQTQVPLVIHWPAQNKPEIVTHLSSHYDIVPSIFKKVLGVKNPVKDYSIGQVLDAKIKREPIIMGSYSNICAFSLKKQQLIVTNHLGYFQMQNLQGLTIADPLDSELLAKAYLKMQQFSSLK